MKKHAGIGRSGNRRGGVDAIRRRHEVMPPYETLSVVVPRGRRPRRPTVLRERFCRRERGVEDAAPYKMVRYTQGVLWRTIQRQRR